jgi:hypothetical protein
MDNLKGSIGKQCNSDHPIGASIGNQTFLGEEMQTHTVLDALLETIPKPDPAFEKRLLAQIHAADKNNAKHTQLTPSRFTFSNIFVSLVVLTILVLALIPAARTLAQELGWLFPRTKTNIVEDDYLPNGLNAYEYERIGLARQALGYDICLAERLPTAYELDRVLVDQERNTVTIEYIRPVEATNVLAPNLWIAQSQNPFLFPIGPSARVESISIRGSVGEYVRGGWLRIMPGKDVGSIHENDDKKYQWSEDGVPLQTLRWFSDGFFFQISFMGYTTQPSFLEKNDLVRIAKNIACTTE